MVDWDSQYVLFKLQYYIFGYAIFFAVLYFLLFVADKSGLCKTTVHKLQASSFHSHCYILRDFTSWDTEVQYNIVCVEEKTKCARLQELEQWHRDLKQDIFECTTKFVAPNAETDLEDLEDSEGTSTKAPLSDDEIRDAFLKRHLIGTTHRALIGGISPNSTRMLEAMKDRQATGSDNGKHILYLPEYHRYLLQRRCLLGCSGVIYEHGYTVPLFGYVLPPGRIEDFILYLGNNHTILGCVFACPQSTHNRGTRRFIVLVQHSVAFFFSVTFTVILSYIQLAELGNAYAQASQDNSYGFFVQQSIDVLIISPLSLSFAEIVRQVYTGKISNEFFQRRPKVSKIFLHFKSLSFFLFTGGCLSLLVLSALLTFGQTAAENLQQYILQVLLPTLLRVGLFCCAE